MLKIWAVAAVIFFGGIQQTEKFVVRVAGNPNPATGIVVGGKEYVSLTELAKLMGASLTNGGSDGGREVVLVPSEPKSGFDEGPDTRIEVDADTPDWIVIGNSNGKLRVRDFTRSKDSWNLVGELDVARQSIMAQGRIPSGKMSLEFYLVMKDETGKTISRQTFSVQGVSFDGGRYPIVINLQNNTAKLPKSVTLRYNSASEPDR